MSRARSPNKRQQHRPKGDDNQNNEKHSKQFLILFWLAVFICMDFFFGCVGVADVVFFSTSLALPAQRNMTMVQRLRSLSSALLWSLWHNGFRFWDAGFDYSIRTHSAHMPPPRAKFPNKIRTIHEQLLQYVWLRSMHARTQQRHRRVRIESSCSFRLFAGFVAMTRRQHRTQQYQFASQNVSFFDRRLFVIYPQPVVAILHARRACIRIHGKTR